MTQNIANIEFLDITMNNYNIGVNSIAKNKGLDVSEYGVIDDVLGNPRSEVYDIGAFEYSETLSYNDFSSIKSIEAYPNPVKDILYLSNLKNKSTKISVYTILGQSVYEQNINDSEITITTANWKKGIYLLIVDGKKYKFIKE